MNMKKILCVLFALGMVLSLCACGGQEPTDPTTTDLSGIHNGSGGDNQTDSTESTDDGLTEYVITIKDTEGKPVVGAMIQICNDSNCMPVTTMSNENGVITTRAAEANYKVAFIKIPAGYTHVDAAVTDYYFDQGATQITITLKAV